MGRDEEDDSEVPAPASELDPDSAAVSDIKRQLDAIIGDESVKPLQQLEALRRIQEYTQAAIELLEEDLQD